MSLPLPVRAHSHAANLATVVRPPCLQVERSVQLLEQEDASKLVGQCQMRHRHNFGRALLDNRGQTEI